MIVSRGRTVASMLLLLAGASLVSALLFATRPTVGGAASWTGDDLAIVGLWCGAVIGSLWLAATTLACVAALARGRTRAAQRMARLAPPIARRILQAALVGTWALVPAAAYAAPPSAPITVHVDPHGRLTTEPRRTAPPEARGARMPDRRKATPTTSRTATVRAATTTTIRTATRLPTHTPTTAAMPSPSSTPAHPAPSTAPSWTRVHVVVPGDNLWLIARAEVSRASGTDQPTDAQIAPYWRRVIAANRTTLRSGNPSLIFPGEVVELP
jgi:nucleoid-associated protein YgaU